MSIAQKATGMNRTTSLYLDLIRLLTAITVFLVHANYGRFTGGLPIICNLKFLGNDGVMAFFVLSGFVIAYITDRKEINISDYAISRFSRLYSVVIPAIILTIILDYTGSMIDYSLYDGWWFQSDNPIWRVTSNILFIHELWFSSVRLFSNGPFWSLGYEFWYYAIFGSFFYLHGKKRYVISMVLAGVAGPKIVILFPVWLLGVITYYVVKSVVVPESLGWAFYLGSIIGYILFQKFDAPHFLLDWSTVHLNSIFSWSALKWSYATPFLNCYAIGILVALHFIGFFAVAHRFARFFGAIGSVIHHLAGATFSIYLFHYPLLQFITALTGGISNIPLKNAVIVFGTLGAAYSLSTVTEMKKAEVKKMLLASYEAIRRIDHKAPE